MIDRQMCISPALRVKVAGSEPPIEQPPEDGLAGAEMFRKSATFRGAARHRAQLRVWKRYISVRVRGWVSGITRNKLQWTREAMQSRTCVPAPADARSVTPPCSAKHSGQTPTANPFRLRSGADKSRDSRCDYDSQAWLPPPPGRPAARRRPRRLPACRFISLLHGDLCFVCRSHHWHRACGVLHVEIPAQAFSKCSHQHVRSFCGTGFAVLANFFGFTHRPSDFSDSPDSTPCLRHSGSFDTGSHPTTKMLNRLRTTLRE
jgi:hypothetical protein